MGIPWDPWDPSLPHSHAYLYFTVPVFAGNEAVLFPGIRERIMTGIPGRPGNGSPGMHSLIGTVYRMLPLMQD